MDVSTQYENLISSNKISMKKNALKEFQMADVLFTQNTKFTPRVWTGTL
jgi:hypothetical protein